MEKLGFFKKINPNRGGMGVGTIFGDYKDRY